MSITARKTAGVMPTWSVQQGWMLVAATALGIVLRFYKLPRQILVDDEWHAIHKLLNSDYFSIATDFGTCMPLTLLFRFLADVVTLNEVWMRLPAFLAGVALVPVLPLLLRSDIGRRAAVALAWLLAVSPFHIHFSRLARPYAITLLLLWLALIAFYRWWRGGHRVWMWTYAAAAALSPWFHLVTLPAVLAPLVLAGTDLVRGRGRAASEWRKAVGLTAAGLVVLLVPPLIGSLGSVSNKLGSSSPTSETWFGAAELLLGTVQPWILLVVGVLMLTGALTLARRQPGFLALAVFTGLAQTAVVVVLRPEYLEVPVVLARYSLFLLPFFLLLIAAGLGRIAAALAPASPSAAGWAAILAAAVLFGFGPLPRIMHYPNNWMGQAALQADYHHDRSMEKIRPHAVPAVYAELARLPAGSALVLEAPWHYNWQYFPFYQQQHRQRTAIGFVAPPAGPARPGETLLNDPRFGWINAIHVFDHGELIRRGVDWVIFHKQLSREMPPPFPVDPVDVTPWIHHYRQLYGPPRFEDDFVAAFMIRDRMLPP